MEVTRTDELGAGVAVGVGAGVGVGVGVGRGERKREHRQQGDDRQRAQPADRQAIYRSSACIAITSSGRAMVPPKRMPRGPTAARAQAGDGSWGPTGCRPGRDDDAPASSAPRASGSAAAAPSCPSGPRFRPDRSGCVRPGPPVTKAHKGAAGLPASPHGPRRCPCTETEHESREIVEDVSTLASSTEWRGS